MRISFQVLNNWNSQFK